MTNFFPFDDNIPPAHIVRDNEIFSYCKPGMWIWVETKDGMFHPLVFSTEKNRFEEPNHEMWLYAEEISAADYEVAFRVWNRIPFGEEYKVEWRKFDETD